MQLQQLLFSQGFGTRHECAGLIVQGRLRIDGRVPDDPFASIDPAEGEAFEVDGQPWRYYSKALVMLHKPAGYECSMKPKHHPSVLSLLPGARCGCAACSPWAVSMRTAPACCC
jgi:16S rRNA pseudouridine516 synthase